MKKCWCGKTHGKGSRLNGELKHFVMSWKLYQIRKDGAFPFEEETKEEEKAAIPALEAVAVA